MFLLAEETKDARRSVLKKLQTLKKNYEFQFVFRKGTRFGSKHISLIVAPCRKNFPKFGFVISKKIGKAFLRNKIRRRLKEIVRSFLCGVKINQYIFVVKPEIENCSFIELKTEVEQLFKKNKLMENE